MGIAGIIASSFIYLVPARPSWNMVHTPIDFLLSAALIGVTLPAVLSTILASILPAHRCPRSFRFWPVALASLLWMANHACTPYPAQSISHLRASRSRRVAQPAGPSSRAHRQLRLRSSGSPGLGMSATLPLPAQRPSSAVLLARYLFFVSVVPLNMALTFTRGGTH